MLPIALQQNGSNSSDASPTLPSATAEPTAAGPDAPVLVPPSTAGMTTKVVKGSLWTLAGQVAPLAVSLVATPFTIRLLGAEGYGVLILVGLIPTYLGFADLGMGIASTKFGSEAYAAGDAEKEARTVRTAAVLSLALSIPFAILIFVLSGWLATLFNVPEHLHVEASLALKVAAFTFVLNFLNSIFNTPQLDRLRMDLNTFVTSGFRMLGIAATPVVIYLGGGILGAVVVLFIASLLTLAGHIYTSGRLLPQLFRFSLDRQALRPMLKFGGALAIAGLASLILLNAEKGILPALVSVEMLAYYSVAFTFASMAIMFGNSLAQSLVPSFSQLWVAGKMAELSELFSRAVFFNLVILVPGCVILAVCARRFFTLWAGPAFGENSTRPLFILLGGLLFLLPAYVPLSLLLSTGKSQLLAKLYWIELLPYLGLLFILTRTFGIEGSASAWAILGAVNGFIYFAFGKSIATLNMSYFVERAKWFSAAVVLLLPGIVLFAIFGALTTTLLIVAVSLFLYLLIVVFKVLSVPERTWLVKRFLNAVGI
ncbi:MAG TPA: oligosaccharide flippase family protein [Pyrinomonadaceae bacterium]|nr:oligosaccharide flippase family protein [Pyrinomonadaceae bacterium]